MKLATFFFEIVSLGFAVQGLESRVSRVCGCHALPSSCTEDLLTPRCSHQIPASLWKTMFDTDYAMSVTLNPKP